MTYIKGFAMSWKFRLINTAIMSFLLSGFMTIYVTWINLGFVAHFIQFWLKAWAMAFPAAFIGVLLLAPVVGKLTAKVIKKYSVGKQNYKGY